MVAFTVNTNNYKDKVAALLDECQKGVMRFRDTKEYMSYLSTILKFRKYSPRNALLIYLQNPRATFVAGYTDWQRKFKRYVKKNEKGIKIFAPNIKKCKSQEGSDEEEIISGFHVVTVFDISQTEGQELPTLQYPIDMDNEIVNDYDILMEALTAFSEFIVIYSDNLGNIMGLCDYKNERILLNIKYSKKHLIATLVHEISHLKLHNPSDRENIVPQNIREMEAESVSYIVCAYFNILYGEFTFRYISSYCTELQLQDFLKSNEKIKNLSIEIIDFLETYKKTKYADKN